MMAGLLGRIAGLDTLRQELKQRTDDLLQASRIWVETGKAHTAATKELSKVLKEHKVAVDKMAEALNKIAGA